MPTVFTRPDPALTLVTPTRTQTARHIGVAQHPFTGDSAGLTPAELADVLLLKSFTMVDGLSVPYRLELELLSETNGIPRHALVARDMSIRVNYSDSGGTQQRYFHGIISRFVQVGSDGNDLFRYRATLVPWLALLAKKTDCKVYRGSIPSVVQAVFGAYSNLPGGVNFNVEDLATYPTLEAPIVQYRESDLQFVMRLMEHVGIYFHFDHTQSAHTMVLTDSVADHSTWPKDQGPTPYATLDYQTASGNQERLDVWDADHAIQPGYFVHRSYHPDLPADPATLMGALTQDAEKDSTALTGDEYDPYFEDLELFDYPGEFEKLAAADRTTTGDAYAIVRMQEIIARRQVFVGRGTYRGVSPGYTFTLGGLTNAGFDGDYLTVSATHRGVTDDFDTAGTFDPNKESFDVSLTAIDSIVQYRPPRRTPKPVVQGPQTATVVGAAGNAIDCDSWGNVYVMFHWDRVRDFATSAVRARVSQSWAGGNHGSVHTPHVGDEVIVEFLEGDPDRPIITGRVYNDTNTPFLTLPSEKDITLVAKDHGGNFIALDAAEPQAITLNTPENSTSLVLGPNGISEKTTADKSVVTVGASESVTLGDSRGVTVGNSIGLGIGTSWGLNIGPSVGIDIGITSSKISVGNSFSASVGYVCNYNRGGGYAYGKAPTLTEGGESVDNHRGLRALNSFEEVRLYAGPDGVGPMNASLVTMTGDTLTLAYGKGTRDTQEGIHNVRCAVVAANVLAIIAAACGAGAAAAAQALTTSIDAEGDDGTDSGRHRPNSDERETLTPGQYIGQFLGLGLASASSLVAAGTSSAILKGLGDRSAPMKDTLNIEDARIDLTTTGIAMTAGTSSINILNNGDIMIEATDAMDTIKLTSAGAIDIKCGAGKKVTINKISIDDVQTDLNNLVVMN